MAVAQKKVRIQHRLGQLRREYGRGRCWVCGTTHSIKTAREGYGTRCKRCFDEGKTCAAVEEFDKLKAKLKRLNGEEITP